MILYIALCSKKGTVTRVIRSFPVGLIREGRDIRELFINPEKLDHLLNQDLFYGASLPLTMNTESGQTVFVTLKGIANQVLFLLYDLERLDQLPLMAEMFLGLLNAPEITGQEEYGVGYYEIQKLNSQLINYQRSLAKTNLQLQKLLEESQKAKNTIEVLEHDTLTGLFTEKVFYERAREMLEKKPNIRFDIIAIDIEHFKIVNEVFGTKAGDRLLLDLAVCLIGLHTDDLALFTRAHADTFFAMIPRHVTLYEELDHRLNVFLDRYPLPMRLQISTGVYVIEDRELHVARMCDRALLAANSIKGNYNSRFARFDQSMQEKLMLEHKIINTMVSSLDRGDFLVYLQPKVNMDTNRVTGAEALVRWEHPAFGIISPADFIPVFEKNGFIYTLDLYVWHKVCCMLGEWKRAGTFVPVSVNVSRTDLYHEDLPDTLADIIRTYALEPCDLHLEITESAYVMDSVQILTIIRQLKEKGFIIEMDDFGSGYSSLNTLSELPIDVMKLDLKFLREAENQPRKQKVMQLVINLAKELSLQVIAEGVETVEQALLLQNMGCHNVQGYLYGRPMPEEEFLAYLTGKNAL